MKRDKRLALGAAMAVGALVAMLGQARLVRAAYYGVAPSSGDAANGAQGAPWGEPVGALATMILGLAIVVAAWRRQRR